MPQNHSVTLSEAGTGTLWAQSEPRPRPGSWFGGSILQLSAEHIFCMGPIAQPPSHKPCTSGQPAIT